LHLCGILDLKSGIAGVLSTAVSVKQASRIISRLTHNFNYWNFPMAGLHIMLMFSRVERWY